METEIIIIKGTPSSRLKVLAELTRDFPDVFSTIPNPENKTMLIDEITVANRSFKATLTITPID